MDIFITIVAFALMLVGLAGIVLPFLPGVPLAWAGLLIYGLVTHFDKVSLLAVIFFGLLMLVTVALDFVAPMLGASKFRASRWGVIGVSIGLMVGMFWFGLPGIILGPLLGALLGEMVSRKPPAQAFRSALGVMIGFLFGTIFKITVVLMMLGYFIVVLI